MGIAKAFRIKKEAEFQNVFDHHQSVANKYFIIYQLANPKLTHWRVGLSVSKKVGKAHERVWVKRRIHQALMNMNDHLLQQVDFLVVARPITNGQSQQEIEAQLKHVLTLAELYHE